MKKLKSINDLIDTSQVKEMSDYDFLKIQADDYNQSDGDLDGLDCHICKNKGYIEKVQFIEMYNDYVLTLAECECMPKRKILIRAKNSGLGEYVNKRFKDYTTEHEWQKDTKKKAIDFVKSNGDEWFCSFGQSGSGKTLISCIVANYLLLEKNRKVLYITWTDFISKLKRDMMSDNSNAVSEYLDKIKNADVLYIDELLKKYNETDLKYIIEIINYRYTKNLKTIISSERVINELLDIDEATFSRVIEKADKYIINIKKDRSKNYRLRNI